MPNYIYKCIHCGFKETVALSISYDPTIKRFCSACKKFLAMTRRIGPSVIPKEVGKVFVGDWYKKQYGHELGAGSLEKAQQEEDRKTLEREFKKRMGR